MEEQNKTDSQGAQVTGQAEAVGDTAPLTVDELTAIVAKLTEENTRKEGEIQRLQGIAKAAQKQGASQETLTGILKRLDDFELQNATLLDTLERGSYGGELETSQPPAKKSHVEELKERRAQTKAQVEESPSYDIDKAKFIQYALGQGYDPETDPIIQEVTDNGNRDPKEALRLLKDKVKASSATEIQKRITEGVQEVLKKRGISTGGIESPSAPTGVWRDKSPEQKILQGVTGKK